MLGRSALIAVALAGALAPAAKAAGPMPGQLYEGPGPKGGSPVTLQVSSSGTRIKYLYAGYERGCRVRGRRLRQVGTVALRNHPIRNGRFSQRRAQRFASTGGTFSLVVTGRFVDGGTRFTGTVRERTRNPQNGVRCDSGTVRFSGAVAERALVNGKWTGSTAQGRPLSLTITGDGVTEMSFEVGLSCGNGQQIVRPFAALAEPASVTSDLEFRASDGRIDVTGSARRALVSGTIVATDVVQGTDAEGEERTYSCSSGDVAFEARRPPGR